MGLNCEDISTPGKQLMRKYREAIKIVNSIVVMFFVRHIGRLIIRKFPYINYLEI
jgi:hypothetical protein